MANKRAETTNHLHRDQGRTAFRVTDEQHDRLLKAAEVAAMLGISVRTTWKLIATRQLPSVRLPGTSSVRVKRSELERYISRAEAQPPTRSPAPLAS